MKKIILIGKTCSGKGHLLCSLQKLGMKFDVISPGGIFRDEMSRGTKLGRQVKRFLDNGLNVPDEITNQVVDLRLHDEHPGKPQFLDGFPRSRGQIPTLLGVPANYYVVHIDTPDDVCRRRFQERKRHDDTERAFEQKLHVFQTEVVPTLSLLKKEFGIVEVDGTQTEHQYLRVIKYCGLEHYICPTRADKEVLDQYALWCMHHPEGPLSPEVLRA